MRRAGASPPALRRPPTAAALPHSVVLTLGLALPCIAEGDGRLDPGIAVVEERRVEAREGTAREAAALFYRGHALEKAGDGDGALERYLAFLATTGRRDLPARFSAMAEARSERLLAAFAKDYDAACALYREDRARGLDALRAIAARHPELPRGRAARALVESDRLEGAIEAARALDKEGRRAEALGPLEEAIRETPHALFRFEAKTLLKELGGPDLFTPAEMGADEEEGGGEEGPSKEKKKDEESVIEVGGGG